MCRRYVCLFCSLQGVQTLQASLFFSLGQASLLSLFRDALGLRFSPCPLGLLRLFFDELLGARLQLAAQHWDMPQQPQMLVQEQLSITLLNVLSRMIKPTPARSTFPAPCRPPARSPLLRTARNQAHTV